MSAHSPPPLSARTSSGWVCTCWTACRAHRQRDVRSEVGRGVSSHLTTCGRLQRAAASTCRFDTSWSTDSPHVRTTAALTNLQYPKRLVHVAPKCQVVDGRVLDHALLVNDEQTTQGDALLCMAQHGTAQQAVHVAAQAMNVSMHVLILQPRLIWSARRHYAAAAAACTLELSRSSQLPAH